MNESQLINNNKEVNKTEEKKIIKLIILFTGVIDRPVPSSEHFQKEMFLLSKSIPIIAELIPFNKDKKGPYSYMLKEFLNEPYNHILRISIHKIKRQEITITGSIDNTHYAYKLTEEGKEYYRYFMNEGIKKSGEKFLYMLALMKSIRDIYEKLTREELMYLIYETYPDYISDSEIYEELKKRKKVLLDRILAKGLITEERYKELLQR